MSYLLLFAAALALLTAVVHAWLGGREVLRPVLAADLHSVARGTMESAWHLLTWHFVVLAGLLAYGALTQGPARQLAAVIGGIQALGYSVIFLVVTLRSFGSPFRLPQWILFLPMALLALAGGSGGPVTLSLTAQAGDVAAVLAAVVLAALSALHVAWAAGSTWPAGTRGELARLVVGVEGTRGMPSLLATLVVAAGLLGGVALVLAARGILPGLGGAAPRALVWVAAAIFALRGIGGYFEPALRPYLRGTPYVVWNTRLYSPVALTLAVLLGAAASLPS